MYFYQLGLRIGLDRLSAFMKRLGVSDRTGIDLPQERRGLCPSAAWYDKHFGAGRWSKGLILNLAIGGDWAAARGIDNAAMPQRMQVDYVRVWQVPRGARR